MSWGKETLERHVEHFISFSQFNSTGAQMTDSAYLMTLRNIKIACYA